MKTALFFGGVVTVLVLALMTEVLASGMSLSLVSQSLNHVEVRAQWEGQPEAWYRLDWDDGSWVDLYGSGGDEIKDHDYEYIPGGVKTYKVSFLGETLEIVIDDRPPEFRVYFPIVRR